MCGSSPNQKSPLSYAPVYLPQLHTFAEFNLKARKNENRIQGGWLNVTDLPVCAGCNFPSSQYGFCNLPAILFLNTVPIILLSNNC